MSDTDLRTLERRFEETGAVADEAAWIAARVRAGELSSARVAVAGLCGKEAARLAAEDWLSKTLEEASTGLGVEPATRRARDAERRALFLRVLGVVDREAADVAEKLAAAAGAPTDEEIRRALAVWALAPKLVCPPAPRGTPRFSVTVAEIGQGPYGQLPATVEHRVVETGTGRLVLQFEETPDFSHPYDPSYANVHIHDDGAHVIFVFADNDGTFDYVVLTTSSGSRTSESTSDA